MRRCLFLGFTDGEKGFSKNVAKNIRRIAHRYGGMSLTAYVTKSWEKGRFNDPYLRDTMLDFGAVSYTHLATAKAITGMQEPIREKQVKVTAEEMVEIA